MQPTWLMTPGAPRCYLGTTAATITTGTAQLLGKAGLFPVVAVTYHPDALTPVTMLAKKMKEKGGEPVIYLWGLDEEEPQVVVRFSVPRPTPKFLRELGAAPGRVKDAVAATGCAEVFELAEAGAYLEGASEFLELYATLGFAAVTISEYEPRLPKLIRFSDGFVAHTIVRAKPTAAILGIDM